MAVPNMRSSQPATHQHTGLRTRPRATGATRGAGLIAPLALLLQARGLFHMGLATMGGLYTLNMLGEARPASPSISLGGNVTSLMNFQPRKPPIQLHGYIDYRWVSFTASVYYIGTLLD